MSDFRLWLNTMSSANTSPQLDFVQPQTRRIPLVVPVALVAGVLAFQGYQFWTPKEADIVVTKPREITRPTESAGDVVVAQAVSAPVASAEENNKAPSPSRPRPSPRAVAPRVSPALNYVRAVPASLPQSKRVEHHVDTDSAALSSAPKENVEMQNQVQPRVVIPEVTFRRHVRLMNDIFDSEAASSNSG
jgi:hypothetical protein